MIASSEKPVEAARPGAVLVWVVLSLSVIVGVVAIVLDGGRQFTERRRDQAAANAAALAGGANLYANYWTNRGVDPLGAAQAAAIAAAEANGVPASAVTVNIPPQSGAFAGQSGYVEVVIQTNLGASFGRVFTQQDLSVHARAVARGKPMQIGLILLAPSGAGTLLVNSPAFSVLNTPIIVDSADPSAYTQQSFGAVIASQFDITGGYSNPGNAIMIGPIFTGVAPTPDPLWYLPIPSPASLTVSAASPTTINSILPKTLQSGVYQGGIHITGSSTVMMQPGVYVMQGGGFVVDSNATVTGTEVMIYNTTSSSYASGPISVGGLSKVLLSAPMSGVYQGISFFQNRTMTAPLSISGMGLTAITGVVYAAEAQVNLTGGALVGADILGGAFVANSMTVRGLGAINVSLGANPPRVPDVRLVE